MPRNSTNIWRILLSRLSKHAVAHLIIPLLIGIFVETLVAVFILEHTITSLFGTQLVPTISLIAGVFVSYILIMYVLIKKETSVRIAEGDLSYLDEQLDKAHSFFGVSIIPLKEWFDPAMQVYLAKLIARKFMANNFQHERVLIFFSDRESRNVWAPLMDENHYGRCLAHLHRDYEIPLSFLNRRQIFKILDELSVDEKHALGCYPTWTKWRLTHPLRRLPLRYLKRRIARLDFAVVGNGEKEPAVLCISKDGEEVRIAREIRGANATPYLRVASLIKEAVRDGDSHLSKDHDFVRRFSYARKQPVPGDSLVPFLQRSFDRALRSPYRESFDATIYIDYSADRGSYIVQETARYKCRQYADSIQDQCGWSLDRDSEIYRLDDFRITLKVPSHIVDSVDFKAKYPHLSGHKIILEPKDNKFVAPSSGLGHSYSLEDFKRIDELVVETYVKYRAPLTWDIVWIMRDTTKGFHVTIHYPPDLKPDGTILGVDQRAYHDHSQPGLYTLRYDSWMLPMSGFVFHLWDPHPNSTRDQ